MSMFITFVMIVINEILHIVMRSNIFYILQCKWELRIVFPYSNKMWFYNNSYVNLIFSTSVKFNYTLGDFLWRWPNKKIQKYLLFLEMQWKFWTKWLLKSLGTFYSVYLMKGREFPYLLGSCNCDPNDLIATFCYKCLNSTTILKLNVT